MAKVLVFELQGAAEMSIAGIAALTSFASAMLLNGLGWTAVNLGAVPMLILAAALTFWFARRPSRPVALHT